MNEIEVIDILFLEDFEKLFFFLVFKSFWKIINYFLCNFKIVDFIR